MTEYVLVSAALAVALFWTSAPGGSGLDRFVALLRAGYAHFSTAISTVI